MARREALEILQRMFGPQADFREGQWEAIEEIALRRRRLLVVQRTGWGKSVVYFISAKLLRGAGGGLTLVISPLLSLMRNQLLAAEKVGIRAATLHSENIDQWAEVESAVADQSLDLLMVSPERLANTAFMDKLSLLLRKGIGLFVVDEAHCISDWGHDFRPDYRRILRIIESLPDEVPVLCTTATANDRVVQDIKAQIPSLHVLRGPLVRTSLRLYNIVLAHQSERLAWLAHFLPLLPGNGIVYTLTVQDARRVAAWLEQNQISSRAYHADLEASERIEIEGQLLRNEVKALVATVALGMGFDKPDLGFVIHFQRPGSVVAYYQQVGRAGRSMDMAFGILLSGSEDDEISDYFIRSAFPPAEVMLSVVQALEERGTLTLDEMAAVLNQSRHSIEKALKLLEVDEAVVHDKKGYSRRQKPWKPDIARYDQVTRLRRAEVEQMRQYVSHQGCLMEFLARALDDPNAAPCGKCMNCAKKTERRHPPAALTQQAVDFLRGDSLVLEPRMRWPKPLLEEIHAAMPDAVEPTSRAISGETPAPLWTNSYAHKECAARWQSRLGSERGGWKMSIPQSCQAAPGRALAIWGDAGWGDEIARGKYETKRFSDALIAAAAALVREKWRPEPPPTWVACVPSRRHPELVRDFAKRLAAKLNLSFEPVLDLARDVAPQKGMQNSVQQARNVLGAFRLTAQPPAGPVLLVDDVVDSGWTVTTLAVLLRLNGSGPVYPLVLAKASPRGS